MITNYHTHTTRCNHAKGTEREYVEAAIKSGLKVLGFSDHAPYPYPDPEPYYIQHTMKLDELEGYCDTVLALREEYKNDIDIRLGLETEYYPEFFDKHIENLSNYPIEYLVLGQHFQQNGKKSCGSGRASDDRDRFIEYCNDIYAAFATGRFSYLAHPDLINFTGDSSFYDEQMRQLCRKANEYNMPVEINFHGYFAKKHYPNEAFWKIAGEENCDVIYALDAHETIEFQFDEHLQRASEMAARCNLHILDDIKIVKPF